MQNIVVCNQPNRLKSIKKFIQSRGLDRYSLVKDSSDLVDYLLVETANVYVFDYYLDMPLVNILMDMRDSINTLAVFVPEERIGTTYLNLTDNIHVMPDEIALLQYMWDVPATALQNVLACHASGKPYCMVNMSEPNIRPDRIQVLIQPRSIKGTYALSSGEMKHEKLQQIGISVKMRGKRILEDEYDIRNQVGIFSTSERVLDIPAVDESAEYSGQEIVACEAKQGFGLTLPSFSGISLKPKEKIKRPKKNKKPKEQKVKASENQLESMQDETSDTIEVFTDTIPPAVEPINETVIEVDSAAETTTFPDSTVESSDVPESSDTKKKPKRKLFAKPENNASDDNDTGILNVVGSDEKSSEFNQVFTTISAHTKTDTANIDVSEANELIENLQQVDTVPKPEPKPEPVSEPAVKSESLVEPVIKASPEPAPKASEKVKIEIPTVQDTQPKPVAPTVTARKNRLSGLKQNNTYATIEEYLVGNGIITAKQKMELTRELTTRRHNKEVIRFHDIVIEQGLVSADDMVHILSKVNRFEILSKLQVDKMVPNFEDFTVDHCKKNRFFRAQDTKDGDVRIICSLSASSIDSTIRRLYDSPIIQYTLDAFVMEKLNNS